MDAHQLTDSEKRLIRAIAFHESGHAVMRYELGLGLQFVRIWREHTWNGQVVPLPSTDPEKQVVESPWFPGFGTHGNQVDQSPERQIAVLMAGIVTEEILLGGALERPDMDRELHASQEIADRNGLLLECVLTQ